ncbi:hypothetical protein [Streptomyces sp. NPDC001604]|uniref:hypothetical protein n=1 Tax=Streptomyces sp. NPDC001604 TaxID=3364593 RepID=UPI0036AD5163
MPHGRPVGLGDVHRDDHGEFHRGQVDGSAVGGHVDPQMRLDLRAAVRAQVTVEIDVQLDGRLQRQGVAAHAVRHRSFPFVAVRAVGRRAVGAAARQNTV